MRTSVISAFILAFIFFTSCKKQNQNPEVLAEFQQIAAKYHLKLVRVSRVPNYHFTDAKLLDQFLSAHLKHIEDSLHYSVDTSSFASSISNPNEFKKSMNFAAKGAGAGDNGNLIFSNLGAVSHLKFYFLNFYAHEFPSTLTLDWIVGQGTAQSQLYYTGVNFGTWSYSQTLSQVIGGAGQGTVIVTGRYTEEIPIAAGFNYEADWTFKATASYSLTGTTSSAIAHAEYDPI